MARPRTPKAKAAVTGRVVKNKARFENRDEPVVESPGAPPKWIKDTPTNKARTAWS